MHEAEEEEGDGEQKRMSRKRIKVRDEITVKMLARPFHQ
jgi:hypothetical protein